ncbi:MAG: TPM domain-containing protein [Leptolyngbyaceae cyanobacterium MO_188.B28]|nr:TPM domain-containing protein [Leptolyngbyaceae cyanobacterium MO_188.B28]
MLSIQCWILPAEATGIYDMPPLSDSTWVVDNAGLLSRLNQGNISNQFRRLSQVTDNQARLVTLHRLDYGETPESFADQLFEQWFPTPEMQAKQTLIVFDDVTNGVAIRVGEQSAQELTDEIAQSVVQETLLSPVRKANAYNKAFIDAADRLVAVLSGQPDPGPPLVESAVSVEGTFATAEETAESRGSSTIIVVGFLIVATIVPMVTYYYYQSMGG